MGIVRGDAAARGGVRARGLVRRPSIGASIQPSALGLPSKFRQFRTYPGFDQLAMATGITEDFERHRFQLCQAPPGVGKSLLYMTAATLSGFRTLVLVGTKGLQSQIHSDFQPVGMRDVRGHSNYPCMPPRDKGGSVSLDAHAADDSDFDCLVPRDRCGHRRDVALAQAAPSVITNFSYWLSIGRYANPDLLGEFDLLVIDEAHTVPEILTEFVSVELTRSRFRGLIDVNMPSIPHHDIRSWAVWARMLMDSVRARIAVLRDAGRQGKRVRRLKLLQDDLASIVTAPNSPVPWIGKHVPGGVRFSPRWGSQFAEQLLFRAIPRVLLCSATLSPHTRGYLGIDATASRYQEVPSPFPAANRPVIYTPTARVDYQMSRNDLRKVVDRIDAAAESRLEIGRPGIIHTRSYDYAGKVIERSACRDYMITHKSSSGKGHSNLTLRQAVELYLESDEPRILVSPSLEEGFDFAGDSARWQVLLKVMVVDSRDPLMAARIKDDKLYRYVIASEAIQQICGRIVRSDSDWGETLIFDDHWAYLRNVAPFPEHFRKAFGYSAQVPPPMKPPVPILGRR